jgi:hypothetical protein
MSGAALGLREQLRQLLSRKLLLLNLVLAKGILQHKRKLTDFPNRNLILRH